jgi:hypothetical protein
MFKSLSYDLDEVVKLFRQRNLFDLRGLSSRLIKEAAIENNFAKAELSVIAYSLHKIGSKSHFVTDKNWGKVKLLIAKNLEAASFAADNNNNRVFLLKIKSVISQIVKIDSEIGNYAQNIYEKAKVKQASSAYSYGLSISQAAALTGADKKELQNYIGFTKMIDEEVEPKTIVTRVDELKELLGGKK